MDRPESTAEEPSVLDGWVKPRKAASIRFAPHISGVDAFRRIMRAGIDHLKVNESAARAGADPEGVHQMRVATRRLRSALKLFEDYVGAEAAQSFKHHLRDLGRVLGEARDWDVFVTETIPDFVRDHPGIDPAAIARAAQTFRRPAHEYVAAALNAPSYAAWRNRFEEWSAKNDWRAGLGIHAYRRLDGKFREIAGGMMDRAARRAAKRGASIDALAPEGLHELRKTMKSLRYGAEFVGSLYPHAERKQYIEAVAAVQEAMGAFNDATVTLTLIERLAARSGEDGAATREALRNWASAKAATHGLHAAWDAFRETRIFWS